MKVGDKLYCIKDYYHFTGIINGYQNISYSYIKNHVYFINFISNNIVAIYGEGKTNRYFNIDPNRMSDFSNYFITETELRKRKLQKINENIKSR
jgi:hypothetical protein